MMLRDQIITFLQTSVVFLLLTNVASAAAAIYALRSQNRTVAGAPQPQSAIERNLQAILHRGR
jgi:hypothetical protein